jgi:HD-like signal output (HDOD) protein
VSTACPTTAALVRELEALPSRPTAAMRIMWMVDDPEVGSAELAVAVSADPALTTRLMRMANSAYYGMSGRVSSAAFAITVLGFETVRALAAAAAAGITDDTRSLPADFLPQSAAAAVATSLVAPRVGASKADAYSVGLLHNLGSYLLHRVDPDRFAQVRQRAGREERAVAEVQREVYGFDAVHAAAQVLESWRFPDEFVQAILALAEPLEAERSPLGTALYVGLDLARCALDGFGEGDEPEPDVRAALKLGFVHDDAGALCERIRSDAERLASSLAGEA